VGLDPSRVGPRAGQPAQLLGQLARVQGGSTRNLVATRLHQEVKPESVEKVGGGPIRPYKYPPHLEGQHTHHTLEIPLAKLSFLV
jgi:hypothetical protein